VHTSIAGYVTAAIFVAGISAWYMLRNRHLELAKRSFRMAALYGVLATIGVITLGDALGFVAAHAQPTKLAAMEGLWKTEPGPMPFNLIAFPDQALQKNRGEVQVPYLLSLLVTHSLDGSMDGLDTLQQKAAQRVENGIPAVQALQDLSRNPNDTDALAQFKAHEADLGYGFLAQRYASNVGAITPAQVQQAARDSIPPVAAVFWSFRFMVGFGLLMLAFFVLAMIYTMRNQVQEKRWFLTAAVWMIPVPFLANEAGWLVAELGRQPWTVFGVLPTWMSVSSHSVGYMVFSLTGFVVLYSIFIAVEMYLMVRSIRQGPGTIDQVADPTPRLAPVPALVATHGHREV
jgi:cytochrome d ubiquinol oxidase subunit I